MNVFKFLKFIFIKLLVLKWLAGLVDILISTSAKTNLFLLNTLRLIARYLFTGATAPTYYTELCPDIAFMAGQGEAL